MSSPSAMQWLADLPHGRGIRTMADGSSYEGEWRMGKREGFGKKIGRNGETYEGWYVLTVVGYFFPWACIGIFDAAWEFGAGI